MKKVLLIEDDAEQIVIYKIPFELEGFDIMTESGGKEGLVKAIGWHPDIILLDIIMEDIDGLEVLRQLKGNKHTKDIPVVMLSNISAKEKIEEAKSLGALAFWEKTKVMPREIVEKCKIILGVG